MWGGMLEFLPRFSAEPGRKSTLSSLKMSLVSTFLEKSCFTRLLSWRKCGLQLIAQPVRLQLLAWASPSAQLPLRHMSQLPRSDFQPQGARILEPAPATAPVWSAG